MKPIRVRLSRTKGWRMPPNTVKVDRSTDWGNPFKATDICLTKSKQFELGQPIGVVGAVQAFRNSIESNLHRSETKHFLRKLRGKNLACWCPIGSPCHADVLLDLANRDEVST